MLSSFEEWVGREEEQSARITAGVAEAMAATLDLDRAPEAGEPLPPGWQWLFFNPAVRRSRLGSDGHPERGGSLPPIELPRRMWAGSRVEYRSPMTVDAIASRRSRIARIENKTGKRGPLWFVTVQHTYSSEGQVRLVEEQDIVYRDAGRASDAPPPRYEGVATWHKDVAADTTLLFRYSALTFNGHRIHYDQAYTRDIEGYPDLVVHGPLTATMLQQFALEIGGGRALAGFDFRGVTPLFVGRPFRLEASAGENGRLALWARGPEGELAMSATAVFR